MQWYYLDEHRQQLETDDEGLRHLAGTGQIAADTLVWNDSMTEWTPLSRALSSPSAPHRAPIPGTQVNPYQAPLSRSTGQGNIRALATILARNAGWTRFFGILTILGGVCTIPIGLFYIWTGVLLFQIAGLAEEAKLIGSEQALSGTLEKTSLYLKANAIFLLVIFLFLLLLFVLFLALGFLSIPSQGSPAIPIPDPAE